MHHQYYIPPYAHSSCFSTQNLSHTMPWRGPGEISVICCCRFSLLFSPFLALGSCIKITIAPSCCRVALSRVRRAFILPLAFSHLLSASISNFSLTSHFSWLFLLSSTSLALPASSLASSTYMFMHRNNGLKGRTVALKMTKTSPVTVMHQENIPIEAQLSVANKRLIVNNPHRLMFSLNTSSAALDSFYAILSTHWFKHFCITSVALFRIAQAAFQWVYLCWNESLQAFSQTMCLLKGTYVINLGQKCLIQFDILYFCDRGVMFGMLTAE